MVSRIFFSNESILSNGLRNHHTSPRCYQYICSNTHSTHPFQVLCMDDAVSNRPHRLRPLRFCWRDVYWSSHYCFRRRKIILEMSRSTHSERHCWLYLTPTRLSHCLGNHISKSLEHLVQYISHVILALVIKAPSCHSIKIYTLTSTTTLELVFSDVWASPISSSNGSKYYVIFVDHFTFGSFLCITNLMFTLLGIFGSFLCMGVNILL